MDAFVRCLLLPVWILDLSHGMESRLIGWSEKPGISKAIQSKDVLLASSSSSDGSNANVTLLSWQPRAFLYHGLLDEAECEHLKKLAKDKLQRSTVVGEEGNGVTSDYRTSQGMFLRGRGQDKIVEQVEKKMAVFSRIPPQYGEAMQILFYGPTQEYKPHMDQLEASNNGGRRAATVLAYLEDVEYGGETIFPNGIPAEGVPNPSELSELSECARKAGLAVKPKKGDALLFYGLDLYGQVDKKALHAGCPVVRGEKWTATKWIHQSTFDVGPRLTCNPPDVCEDLNVECARWASVGECQKNPTYMLGEGNLEGCGQCRKSCDACTS